MPELLPRHTLVWVDVQVDWQALTPAAAPRIQRWLQARLPAIVARSDAPLAADVVRLGIPLPLAEDRQRLSLQVPRAAIGRHASPPPLDQVMASAPAPWRDALGALQHAAARHGLQPRVFGSFAWQALTGLQYVHLQSDIDLLWDCGDAMTAMRIITLLREWERRYGLRADGELLLPAQVAVNWREYAEGGARLLGKSVDGCALVQRAALFIERSAA